MELRNKRRGETTITIDVLKIMEVTLGLLLVFSFFAGLNPASAVVGVSSKLSYQGRLTDLSGNPLGGSGTNYCFRFSIYDASTGGTKLWPSGTPASTTVRVEDGVFNTDLGSADSLATFDFSQNNTIYLQVEINATPTTCGGSWESLDVRQRIDAVGYARVAEGVYSSLLRAPTGGTAVQIGTGSGAATPIFLGLDVKNTDESVGASCTTSGQLWYNSTDSKARICQGSVIRDLIDGLLVREEGVDVGRASVALDFVGDGATVTEDNGVITISIPGGSGAGKAILGGRSSAALSADAYCFPTGYDVCGASAVTQGLRISTGSTLRNLAAHMSAAQGNGDTCTVYVQLASGACTNAASFANTALTCSIVNTAQSCTDTSNTVSVSSNDCMRIYFDEAGGTCSGNIMWSFEVE